MAAVLMDGKKTSALVRGEIAKEVERMKARGVTPGLAVVIVGSDPASQIYVRNKHRACDEVGMYSEVIELPEETTEEELIALVHELNGRADIHGILCQAPLPKHINETTVIDNIRADKDVDAFHGCDILYKPHIVGF